MKTKLPVLALVVLMVLPSLPGTVVAQQPDPGPAPAPGPAPGPGDTPASAEAAFDEAFVKLENYECPFGGDFEQSLISGATAWRQGSHHDATDGCTAQWGEGTYQRGSEAVLEAPGLPTGHLAASNRPSPTLNDVGRTLIENGANPVIVARVLGGMADGCRSPQVAQNEDGYEQAVTAMCRELLRTSAATVEVPDVPAGLGALYLELHHAYDFSEPNENNRAVDGGWVEVRQPGEDWKRLEPIALYAPATDAYGSLCTITGPPSVAMNRLAGVRPLGFTSLRGWVESGRGTVDDVGGNQTQEFPRTFETIPSSEKRWRDQCGGLLRNTYGTSFSVDESVQLDQETDAHVPPQSMDRFTPYPGQIRGEGAGFVGSTHDASGELQFVDHWFDLSSYAGETIEVRFHATGGAGLGAEQGGWWIDDVNVRYAGPPKDVAVRLDKPQEGDSLPTSASEITPGGEMPVSAVVRNLGRTTSEPVMVEFRLDGATKNVSVDQLEPLGKQRVTAMLPIPDAGQHNVVTRLLKPSSGQTSSTPYNDTFPANDHDNAHITVETKQGVDLRITETKLEGDTANVTIEVTNHGNAPLPVGVEAALAPVDLNTRRARLGEAQPLGEIANVTVPHGNDVNSFGLEEPVRRINETITLPDEGVWAITLASTVATARDSAFVAFGEATPTALETKLDSVVEGPTPKAPRGGFELVGPEARDRAETPVFRAEPRDPISGPETRFVPGGDTAMASSGQELPAEWAPVSRDNPAHTVFIGPDDDGCGTAVDVAGDELSSAIDGFFDPIESVTENPCVAPTLGLGANTTDDARAPASLQAWNIRQHHVSIYGVGTKAETGDETDDTDTTEQALAQLRPREDGERVLLEFEHAANVNWTNGQGSQARLVLVPKGDINLVEELHRVENETRNMTQHLPPQAQAVANTAMMGMFFDQVADAVAPVAESGRTTLQSTGITRVPGDVCTQSPSLNFGGLDLGAVNLLQELCGEAQILETLGENACPGDAVNARCEFTEQDSSTYLRTTGEAGDGGLVTEWRRPSGWENVTLDVTSLVENTTTAKEERGFYVMFDLVTTTDMEDTVASAQADTPGRNESGDEESYTVTTGSDTEAGAGANTGWSRGERPLWTVDDPRLTRVSGEETVSMWCLRDNLTLDGKGRCSDEDRVVDVLDHRGWEPIHEREAKELPWRFEPLGGDPESLEPGAFVWEGGTGGLIETSNGVRTAINQAEPDAYSVLSSPRVELSGYETPVAKLHVKWDDVSAGGAYSFLDKAGTVEERCTKAKSNTSGTVWTRTGWNVRVRPVHDDGSLGGAQTVRPIGGYHQCSSAGHVPILFNATAIERSAHFLNTQGQGNADAASGMGGFYQAEGEFQCQSEFKSDPMQFCLPRQLQFGHGQPVYALPMSWQDVTLDLSEFRGQEVQVEIHAFGIHGEDRSPPRGELRVDSFAVTEGTPPIDLAVQHEKRPFIAPGSEERFNLTISNEGRAAVEDVWIRRSIISGETNCQPDDIPPEIVHWPLSDPETGAPGLPPGATFTIQDRQLAWDAPDEENQLFERRLTIETQDTLEESIAPDLKVQQIAGLDARATVTAIDEDDCAEDVDVNVTELRGNPEIEVDGSEVTIAQEETDDDDDRDQFETGFTATKVAAVDKHGVEGLPVYVSPPPRFVNGTSNITDRDTGDQDLIQDAQDFIEGNDEDTGPETRTIVDPEMELNGTADATVLQSALSDDGTGSLVRVDATAASQAFNTKRLVIPCETGTGCEDNLIVRRNFDPSTEIHGLSPGHYVGYVMFGGEDYAPVNFTIEKQPEPGQDARPGDNAVTLRGQTRSVPDLRISEVALPDIVNATESVTFPIKIENIGNVPLENVTTEVTIQPGDIVREADRIPLLEPGDAASTTATIEIARAGPFQVKIETRSEPTASTGEVGQDATGTGLLVLNQHVVSAEPGDHQPWRIGETIQFGDGVRVPADTNATLPMTGQMDLARSPLSALFLNHTGHLERSYDGVGLEWTGDEGVLQHRLPGKLTSSHAGGVPGERTPAFTGDLNASVAWSTDLPGARPTKVDAVTAEEWRHRGNWKLDVDSTFTDSGSAFWMPTATLIGSAASSGAPAENSQIEHEISVPLTKGEWCTITDEMVPQRIPFRIRTLERRLFSEPSTESRGWDVTVRLETGSFPGSTVSGKFLPASPVVPLPDEETTRWESVEYDVPLSPLVPAAQQGAVPWNPSDHWTPDEPFRKHAHQASCEVLETHPSKEDELTNAKLVFQLRASPQTAQDASGALDVGWFLSQIEVPELGLSVGASQSNHVAQECDPVQPGWSPGEGAEANEDGEFTTAPDSLNTKRSVLGCTQIGTGSAAKLGSMTYDVIGTEANPNEPLTLGADRIKDRAQIVQSVDLSRTPVTNHEGNESTILSDLLKDRPLQDQDNDPTPDDDADDRQVDLTPTVDADDDETAVISPGSDGRFRYVDTVALMDLRSGTRGNLIVELDSTSQLGVAQIVAAPIRPGESSAETAPHRAPWQLLELVDEDGLMSGVEERVREDSPRIDEDIDQTLCEPNPLGPSQPRTPLGATRDRVVGPVGGDEDALRDADHGWNTTLNNQNVLCADLSPVGGELVLVGLRLWLPDPGTQVAIHDASAWLAVPQPQRLDPQLRAMTDDTVHEGTYTLNDASLLTMAPEFSHNVQAHLNGTQNWTLEDGRPRDVLVSNGFPDLTINVTEPARASTWDLSVSINASYQKEEGGLAFAHGEVDLDQETYQGSQEIEIPWEQLREAFDTHTASEDEHDDDSHAAAWLTKAPVLPENVTRVTVDVSTTPDALVEGVPDCPSDLEDLRLSEDLECRRLADLVAQDDAVEVEHITEFALHEAIGEDITGDLLQDKQVPGVRSLDVQPARAEAGTPRTAHITLENPSSRPVELRGKLTLEDIEGETLKTTRFPSTIVRAWETETVELPLGVPSQEEPLRVRVVAEIGDQTIVDDYRTTTFHTSNVLDPRFFDTSDSGVTRTAAVAKPELPGQTSDGVGWRIESDGGHGITALRTDFIRPDSLRSMLQDEDRVPVLAVQHQRVLRGDPVSHTVEHPDGDFSYMTANLCAGGSCTVLDGWAPDRSRPINYHDPNSEDNAPSDACTEGPSGDSSETSNEGIQRSDSGQRGSPVIYGSTGSGQPKPEILDAWKTAIFPFDPSKLPEFAFRGAQFSIMLGECLSQGKSTILVDDVSLGSARPIVTIGAEDIPLQPGTEKRYRFTFTNDGGGASTFHMTPSATLPEGWELSIELSERGLVYDSTTGDVEPVHLEEEETIDGIFRLEVPGSQAGGITRALPITAYAVEAPGLMSSGAVNASIHEDQVGENRPDVYDEKGYTTDPGRVTFETQRTDQPDLRVGPTSVKVEDAEVGRQAKLQFKVVNHGTGAAKDVPIRVSVDGPSGFETLEGPDGETVREDFPAGARKFFTYTWNPREAGEHRLRIVADPDPEDVDILISEGVKEFFGLVQESEECDPDGSCANVADHTIDVEPLQKPELSLTVRDAPDRISAGQPTTLEVVVRNDGGRTARDATLSLSENGLLPIFDTLTIDLPEIEPGNATVLHPRWTPVTPGEILLLGSVSAPGEFTGQRGDGINAGADNDVAVPVRVDRARTSLSLSEPIRTQPGQAHVVEATLTNDGTSTLTVSPEAARAQGVFLSPVLEAPLEVPPGQERTLPVLGFAMLGTTPRSVELPFPVSQGRAEATVTVLESPGARVTLDERPVKPGTSQIDARVSNEGNVPLDGTLMLRGQGIVGDAEIDVPVGRTVNVTVPTTIQPGATPGVHEIATHVQLDGAKVTEQHRVRVDEAPAVAFDLEAGERALAGSSSGALTVTNVGNQPLDGRLTLDGPVSLAGSALLDLAPGERVTRNVTWLSSANRTGTATVVGFEGQAIGTTALEPSDTGPELELLRVSTRPSVNLQEGMEVQVVGAVENAGSEEIRDHTLGITIDGELYQTFDIESLEAGETTVVSAPIELPRSGELTIGLVDLAAFQRGETAGPATTIDVASSGLGLGTIRAIPTIPWYALLGLVVLAAGVKRR